MKIAFYTLGCKVNQYESNWMGDLAKRNGFILVCANEDEDVYVINSSTVTSESDRKTRQAVRRFKRNHPDSIVVLTGCMPQAFPEDAKALKEADIVIGNKSNSQIIEYIKRYLDGCGRIVDIAPHKSKEMLDSSKISGCEGRPRAYVKIEDGCDRFCSYCIIPYSRGRVRSKPLAELKDELKELKEHGFSEVVLVGINLSAYGKDTGERVCDAVKLACDTGFKRVRLGSLEPDHITDEDIKELSALPQLSPQFHITLQNG